MVTTDDELYTEDTEIPKAMEEVKSDRHPQTRKRLYITKELQTNLTIVSHIQVVRTYDPKPTELTDSFLLNFLNFYINYLMMIFPFILIYIDHI